MNIVLFKDLTTEEALVEIEKESAKYEGLYVDMYDKEQRKFVKEKASLIGDLLKKVERARIGKNKEFKTQVELEAKSITDRLQTANVPFTTLIDEHKEARAKVLAMKKAAEEASELVIQIKEDEESAITLDKMRTFEIEDAKRQQIERDEQIANESRRQAEIEVERAEERAEQAEKQRILSEAQAKRDAEHAEKQAIINAEQYEIEKVQAAEQARQDEIKHQADEKSKEEAAKRKLEANKKHVGSIRCEIKVHLMKSCKIEEDLAKKIVLSLLKTDRVTINY